MNCENGSGGFRGRHGERAAVSNDDFARNVQTERHGTKCAVIGASLACSRANERINESRKSGWWDRRALIGHGQENVGAVISCRDFNRFAFIAMLNGVADEIGENLPQPRSVLLSLQVVV